MNNIITMKAYGKVNFALDALRKKANGYHELRMIMQTLDIFDELTFSRIDERDSFYNKEGKILLECDKSGVPTDERNLIYKAIKLMEQEYNFVANVKVYLKKNIPVEAGMAGGSTDCAITLKAINLLYKLGATDEKLCEIGVKIGADVPYCIMGGTVLSEGIGEILTPLPNMPDCYILLTKPSVGVSTKEVYTNLRVSELEYHPDVDAMISFINENDIVGVSKCLSNVLETVTISMHPVIDEVKNIMKNNGALNALMSGSGPTIFGVFEDEEIAMKAEQIIKNKFENFDTMITKPVGREVYDEARCEYR